MRIAPLLSLVVALSCATQFAAAQVGAPADAPMVTLTEDATSYTLSNGIVTGKVQKRNGDLTSMVYKGMETLTDQSGRAGGYWSHDAGGGTPHITKITLDPKDTKGERAEVLVKAVSGGKPLGRPAGLAAGAEGDFPADIEIRYTLGRGDSGIYTSCTFDHLAEYPAGSIGEARYVAKLAAMYDWISVDEKRNKLYAREPEGEDKYVYTALQSENLAYGWGSTTKNTGFYLINPTIEYLSGGPTKPEFLCHRDTTAVQAPCVLNYWRSSHYGGAVVSVAAGERWTKTIGPFMLYVNTGPDPIATWKEARGQAAKESAKWPYDWVTADAYPHKNERSTVSGQLALNDPLMPGGAKFPGKLTVGFASPTYTPPGANGAPGRPINWQLDAKHYQFWASNEEHTGKFTVPNVDPGEYTLYAFADGILGEFSKANVKIEPGGKPVDLGKIDWAPVRKGKQLWDIGIANRTAAEFFKGDVFFEMDISLQYPKLFPNDVHYTIGKSDFSKDWFFQQVPHNVDPNATVVPFSGVRTAVPPKPTPYAIDFDMPNAPKGKVTLRLAICGTGTRAIEVSVNGQPAGQVTLGPGEGVITRHQVQGLWYEREFAFDASMLKQGANNLTLTVPAAPPNASVNNGVVYDYLRLELDENAAR